jgi:uncharacterized protein YggE
MKRLFFTAILFSGAALAQTSLDANSIVVTAVKNVILPPTDVTFMVNVSAEFGTTLEQVLAAVDLGLTAQDLTGINSYPIGPYPPVPNANRINFVFRLSVPLARMKETVDRLEKLRKTLDSGMDLSYNTVAVGPSLAAAREARDKALPELMADAQKRAQVLASAAQLKLGAIQGVSEPYSYADGPGGAVAPNVTLTVTVRFAAQP